MISMAADSVSGEAQTPFHGWSQTAELLYIWQRKQRKPLHLSIPGAQTGPVLAPSRSVRSRCCAV